LPDDDEAPDYHIPLEQLTGKHGYALARDEESDEPPDPGAPVAYVADPLHERPNALTIEGMIAGIGLAAHNAARDDDPTPTWVMRALAIAFLFPTLFLLLRAVGIIH
jgi:hypothetical protein